MLRKLRIKFVCMMMGIVTIMLCIILGMVIHFTALSLENQSIQMMQAVMASPFPHGRPNLNHQTDQVQLPFFAVQIGIRGELISTGGGYFDLSDEKELMEITFAAYDSGDSIGVLPEYGLRYSKISGSRGYQIVFADMSSEKATMDTLIRNCIFIGICSMAGFLLISILLARWAVKPVERAWNQQKQFVADASHELKTPLSVIMTNAELLEYPDYDAESRLQFVNNILNMTRKMRGLVENLLELARLDNGAVKTNFAPLDISSLMQQETEPFEALCYERNIELTVSIEAGVRVRGSEAHLRQIPGILLDNAMKYYKGKGEIRVSLNRSGNNCILSVSNPGDTLLKEDLINIFKRFYRVDKARSSNGSYGLGLSIAQAIMEEHHGKIWAESDQGINSFHVKLRIIS